MDVNFWTVLSRCSVMLGSCVLYIWYLQSGGDYLGKSEQKARHRFKGILGLVTFLCLILVNTVGLKLLNSVIQQYMR